MIIWKKGDDFRDDEDSRDTYGIHKVIKGKIIHGNAIEIYTSKEERDAIIDFLNFREKHKGV